MASTARKPAPDQRVHRTADGAEIVCRARPGRDPWILLHGLGCDASLWDGVVAELPAEVGILIPELRGHGGSTLGWRLPSIEVWAEDVAALAEREGLKRPAVAGLSMGGYTALALAEARPGLARAYAFVSTQAGADDEAARGRRAEGLATLRRGGWRAVAEGLMPYLLAEGRPDFARHREQMLRMFERAGDAGLAAALFALANRADRRTVLPRIRVPAVAVVGDADRLTPPDQARAISGAMTDCRLVVLPGVAHMSALEAPRQVAAALIETGALPKGASGSDAPGGGGRP